jgi:meso-butanediol dehydrogenase/(S,S)-butanediol dehydrogenase/diacetyl reductase
MDLKDSVAIVTGAGRGIGRGISLALAREGTHLVLADLPPVDDDLQATRHGADALGVETLTVHCDVTDWSQVESMVKQALERFEHVDVLVNNAGVISVAPVVALAEEQWDRVMDVNVKGTFLCSKAVAAHMMERRRGRIVNLSSIAGKQGSAGVAHYCASKWAVIGFTQALAHELASFGVTVNAVCPGIVDSAMWQEQILPALSAVQQMSKDDAWERFVRERIPLGRPQTPEDIGEAVVYLCRAENVTGETVNVSGGSEMG